MLPSVSVALRVGLFGAGRVAAALGPALAAAGHHVVFVAGRTLGPAQALATQLPACQAWAPPAALPPADVYLLAVPDAAVPELLGTVPWPAGAVVAHLAGAVPLAVFEAAPRVRGGVLYPLQTFSAGRAIDWPVVPLFVEATSAPAEARLLVLARSLSQQVALLGSAQRLRLHLGAVWASNFTNHLLGVAQALLAEASLPFELLHPLVRETVAKALAAQPSPFGVQTGPAVRRDAPTLAAHEAALAAHPAWQALYAQLSASIAATEEMRRGQKQ
ncbi:DUF2520 domain-containing protein [Hymenobacter sp. H14-R3]|uniref:Rossmann-like and DUF2520 domain-containing protein n=1 Tax=Hymenobacter sp. H14-R3 TaxID=3046308 RepID=UPI0024B8FAB5|nr:Rossmann-like and DUF2520 domain-containing protein [Hymenobacter sp. H14-R3]MDJ0363517.1 DUF2520 domain-containing protein [Hymenobacter sp. H14-R3]